MRIGVIGTGRIARRFLETNNEYKVFEAVTFFKPKSNSGRADWMKDSTLILTNDWQEFMAMVDLVYIASPHGSHMDYIRRSLADNKHVLCEKPMCFSAKEAKEIFELADSKKLILMEAVKTSFCPGFLELEKVLATGIVGDIKDVEAAFTKLMPFDSREMQDEVFGGSLIELGTYVLLPMWRFLGTNYSDIRLMTVPAVNGKDWFTKISLEYGDGPSKRYGLGKTGLGVKTEGEMIISGTKGYVIVKAPWWLTSHFEVHYEDPNIVQTYDIPYEGSGMQYEMQEFVERVKGKPKDQWIGISREECACTAEVLGTVL